MQILVIFSTANVFMRQSNTGSGQLMFGLRIITPLDGTSADSSNTFNPVFTNLSTDDGDTFSPVIAVSSSRW